MWSIACALVVSASLSTAAGAIADSPTVTPATGGAGEPSMLGMFTNEEALGYQLEEYFLSGNAHSYTSAVPLASDGKWHVTPNATTASFKTRALVIKPADPRRFNGTVYVEWFNVSGGLDASPDWTHGHIQMAREGAAYVGVSAQFVGVNTLKGGGSLIPGDPVRYASLSHPGDSFSYDIFSQAGQAVWNGALLGSLTPRRLIAVGESQSAGRLVTYINAVHPLVDVYDGFLVHSRSRSGSPLSQDPLPLIEAPVPTEIRADSKTPVIVFQDETDVAGSLLQARQPEHHWGRYRLWEVAGTAHFDSYGLVTGPVDIGDGQGEVQAFEQLQNPIQQPIPGIIECALPINAGPQHWVINAALHWINLWVRYGTAPRIAPRLHATTLPGVSPVVFASDVHGNTVGGIRTPFVDVPIAKLTGIGNGAGPNAPDTSRFCSIFGQTIPFTDAQLASLYRSHGGFVLRYFWASLKSVFAGHLLLPDAVNLLRAARQTDIGSSTVRPLPRVFERSPFARRLTHVR
jgi:hypothetical protein